MAYSKAEKEEVLARFHVSGFSIREACRVYPEFPCAPTLREWIRLEDAGALEPARLEARGRCEGHVPNQPYPTETKREAVRLLRMGWEPPRVAKRLGVSSPRLVAGWGRRAGESGGPSARVPDAEKRRAVARLAEGEPAAEIAEGLGVHARTVYRRAERAGGRGGRPAKKSQRKAEKALNAGDDKSSGRQGERARAWGGPARGSRGGGPGGGGAPRRGAGGVGRPKSTRPGLFEQPGEAPGGRGGEGGDGEGEA